MRRIKKARIQFVSLVPKGANGIATIYKDDGSFNFGLLVKDAGSAFADKGELVAVVYAPERRDSQGDIASAEVIKEALYESARNGFDIDIRHDGKAVPRDKAFVAESFIVQKNDPRFTDMKDYSGTPVDPTGSWGVVLKIDDQELRKLYREGKWGGVSMAGVAVVEHHKSDDDADNGELEMKPEELEAALKKSNETLAASIAKSVGEAVSAALKPADEKKKDEPKAEDGVPVFKGEKTVENLRKHRQAVQRHNIVSSIDWSDATSVEKGEKALAALEEEIAKAADDGEGDDEGKDKKLTPEQRQIANLEKELTDLRKRSNAGKPGKGKAKSDEDEDEDLVNHESVGVEKEDGDLMAEGLKAAREWNKKTGRAD